MLEQSKKINVKVQIFDNKKYFIYDIIDFNNNKYHVFSNINKEDDILIAQLVKENNEYYYLIIEDENLKLQILSRCHTTN